MYFYIFFHPNIFLQKILYNNFQFLNTYTKQTQKISYKFLKFYTNCELYIIIDKEVDVKVTCTAEKLFTRLNYAS